MAAATAQLTRCTPLPSTTHTQHTLPPLGHQSMRVIFAMSILALTLNDA